MKFDVDAHLSAIGRSVAFLERDGKPASTVTISRSFDAPLLDLWSAVTEAERIPLWFLPITGELKLGGRYQRLGVVHATGENRTRYEPCRHYE